MCSTNAPYLLDNAAAEAPARLALDDEDFMMPSSILWSVWGQRPDAP
jgi:hypothetical protein